MRQVKEESLLLNGRLIRAPGAEEDRPGGAEGRDSARQARDNAARLLRSRAEARGRPRPELDPLPLGLAAAGAGEVLVGVRLAGRLWRLGAPARHATVARTILAGAVAASARRADWRLPLISTLFAVRLLEWVVPPGDLISRRTRGPGRQARLATWLLALWVLRREAARPNAWEAPRPRWAWWRQPATTASLRIVRASPSSNRTVGR